MLDSSDGSAARGEPLRVFRTIIPRLTASIYTRVTLIIFITDVISIDWCPPRVVRVEGQGVLVSVDKTAK